MKISINNRGLTPAEVKSLRAVMVHFFRTTSDLIQNRSDEVFFMQRTAGLQVLDLIDGRASQEPPYETITRQHNLRDTKEAHVVIEDFLCPVPYAMVIRMAVSHRVPSQLMTDSLRNLRTLLITGYQA